MFETKIYIASVKSLYDKTLFEKLYKTVPEYRRKKIDSYSDIKDTSTDFHLRYVYVGDDVELP